MWSKVKTGNKEHFSDYEEMMKDAVTAMLPGIEALETMSASEFLEQVALVRQHVELQLIDRDGNKNEASFPQVRCKI